MTTARDAIELAREHIAGHPSGDECYDCDIARALLAEHERAARLEAGLDAAIEILDEAGIDDDRTRALTEIRWPTKPEVVAVFRGVLQEKP